MSHLPLSITDILNETKPPAFNIWMLQFPKKTNIPFQIKLCLRHMQCLNCQTIARNRSDYTVCRLHQSTLKSRIRRSFSGSDVRLCDGIDLKLFILIGCVWSSFVCWLLHSDDLRSLEIFSGVV